MAFDPTSVPAGCVYRPVPFAADRPLITPRSIFAHTMAASVRTTVQSGWNHALRAPHKNTLPHYALGLDAADGCAKFLPTNRRGIATATVTSSHEKWPTLTAAQRADILAHGNRSISWWSLAIETADTGYRADAAISAFTDYQLEMLTRIYVHECAGWSIPAVRLPVWHGAGCATHTDPWNFPYTTLFIKNCPGSKKKAQFWSEVLPEVQRRLAPAPPPDPPVPEPVPPLEVHMLPVVAKTTDGAHLACFGHRDGAYTMGNDGHQVTPEYVFGRGGYRAFDLGSGRVVSWSPDSDGTWAAAPIRLSTAQALNLMGGRAS